MCDAASHLLDVPKDGGHGDPLPSPDGFLSGASAALPEMALLEGVWREFSGPSGSMRGGGVEGSGFVGGGLPVWDPSMLDRMQAADVCSGMSGIDPLSDSGGASGCEDEELGGDDYEDEDEDEDMDESEPREGDEDDMSGQGATDDWDGERTCGGGVV